MSFALDRYPLMGTIIIYIGMIMIAIGFFLPVLLPLGFGSEYRYSQWDMVEGTYLMLRFAPGAIFLCLALVLPFLAILLALTIYLVTAWSKQQLTFLIRWKRRMAVIGAVPELLFGPVYALLSVLLGAKFLLGPGFVLLMLGSIMTLFGVYLELKARSSQAIS